MGRENSADLLGIKSSNMDMELYFGQIITSIMVFDRNIKGVKNLEFVKIFSYTQANDRKIADLIRAGKIDEISQLPETELERNDGYDFSVVKFLDDNNSLRAAIVYDSDDMWQNPQTLEVFSI